MGTTDESVLVTGVTGFIGLHTAIRTLNEGYRVRGSMRNLDRADDVRSVIAEHAPVDHLEFVEADLLDPDSWHPAAEGCTYVLHLASPFPSSMPKDPDELIAPARQGTLNVMEASARACGNTFPTTERSCRNSSCPTSQSGCSPSSTPKRARSSATSASTRRTTRRRSERYWGGSRCQSNNRSKTRRGASSIAETSDPASFLTGLCAVSQKPATGPIVPNPAIAT